MPISWNEIKARALAFSRDWADVSSESAEAKTFWNEFFHIFGISRRRVAAFEMRVKKIDGRDGYIDLLWKGVLLIEHKSRGKDLTLAHRQALDYFPGLKERELPRYIMVSDFARFCLYDLENGLEREFALKDLHRHARLFGFIAGYQTHAIVEYGLDATLPNHGAPICPAPRMGIGNKPIDGGAYLFTEAEKNAFLEKEPQAAPYFRRWLGAMEFLNGYHRYCLWLGDCSLAEMKAMPEAMKRVRAARDFRLASKSAPTRKLAETPTRFHVENMPKGNFLIIPKVSSVRRRYIPIGFESPQTLCSDLVFIVPDATPYHFGVLQSTMHNAWTRTVCGRLKSDYRYSVGIVYNNFPWPENPDDRQVGEIEATAREVLDARDRFPDSSLADLYDPLTMPPVLLKAHQRLDKAVDGAYGKKRFDTEAGRVAFLFELYGGYI